MKRRGLATLILAAMIAVLIPLTSANAGTNENWATVGNAGFSADEAHYTSLAFDSNDTPHLAYRDEGNGGRATVMKYDGSAWTNVGNAGFSAGVAVDIMLAIDSNDTPYVAYSDNANSGKATVMKFDGTAWVNVGNAGFSAAGASDTTLAISSDDVLYVSYVDIAAGRRATVMKYNGSSWENVGNAGFSNDWAVDITLAIDSNDTPYVAYSDNANSGKATVMKFDGTAWVNVGHAGFSADWVSERSVSLAIAVNGASYIAYSDSGNSFKATVMKFNGTDWVNVGNPGFSAGDVYYTSLAFNSSDTPYIAYKDASNSGKATVMKFNGTSWANVSNTGFSANTASYTSLAIDSNDMPYVAYMDGGNSGKATVMRLNVPPTCMSLDDNNIAENEPIGNIVGAFSTVDPDKYEAYTYSVVSGVGDTDNCAFTIDGNQLRTAEVFDYETKNVYSIRVRVADKGGLYIEDEYRIEVTDVNENAALTIDTSNLLAATIGERYSCTVSASGGDGSYSWYASSLPSGLGIERDTGTISGTPNETGDFSVEVRVYDGTGKRTEKTYSLLVNAQGQTGKYTITPETDSTYTVSTPDGFATLTIGSDVSGFRHFKVRIDAVITHAGEETVAFVHMRDNVQIGFCTSVQDFDIMHNASVGFNVSAGDVIRIYIVDRISNDPDTNPMLLQ